MEFAGRSESGFLCAGSPGAWVLACRAGHLPAQAKNREMESSSEAGGKGTNKVEGLKLRFHLSDIPTLANDVKIYWQGEI